MCSRPWPSPTRSSPAATTSDSIHYVGASARRRTPPAATDRLRPHAARRRRPATIVVDPQPRRSFPKLVGSTWRALRLIRHCRRRSSSTSVATPAFRPRPRRCCSRVPYRRGQLRPPARPGVEADGAPRRGVCRCLRRVRRCRERSHRRAGSAKRCWTSIATAIALAARSAARPASTTGSCSPWSAARSAPGGSTRSSSQSGRAAWPTGAIWPSITSSASAICPMPRPLATAATASCIECVDTRTGCRWSMPQPI